MAASEQIQRVRIYLRERDRWEGQPLYTAILNQLQREGATGATALRGLAGFGPGQRVQTTAKGDAASDAPVVIEWVDRAERINRLLPLLDTLLPNALTTVEDIRVYRAALRSHGPFANDEPVGNFALRDVVTLRPDDTVAAPLNTMLGRDQNILPVLDERGVPVGIITGSDIQRRAGLTLPLRLLRVLSVNERKPFLEPLTAVAARDCMTSEPRCVNAVTDVLQALIGMLEWNYATLPVVGRDGQFAGLLTGEGVLQAAAKRVPDQDSAVRNADPPTLVQLVMQMAVPQASITQPLATILQQLIATPQRFLVLTDAAGRVRGTLSDADALRALEGEERVQFLAALTGAETTLPGIDRGPETVLGSTPHTIAPNMTIEETIQRFVTLSIERAPVVNDGGKLLGLVSRTTLLRALAQST